MSGENVEVVLSSGGKLAITRAPFPDSMALHKALLRSGSGLPAGVELMQMDVSALRDVLINAATSDEVERALFKCFERCTYESVRITPQIFDDPKIGTQAREDYYEAASEVVKVNCGPFVKRIVTRLKEAIGKLRSASPESPSGQTKP